MLKRQEKIIYYFLEITIRKKTFLYEIIYGNKFRKNIFKS